MNAIFKHIIPTASYMSDIMSFSFKVVFVFKSFFVFVFAFALNINYQWRAIIGAFIWWNILTAQIISSTREHETQTLVTLGLTPLVSGQKTRQKERKPFIVAKKWELSAPTTEIRIKKHSIEFKLNFH